MSEKEEQGAGLRQVTTNLGRRTSGWQGTLKAKLHVVAMARVKSSTPPHQTRPRTSTLMVLADPHCNLPASLQ